MNTIISRQTAAGLLPTRPRDGHKGTFGHTFVIAGSRRYPGAMRLTCEAASRSGVGLVTAGIPRSLADVAAMALLECMSLPLPDTAGGVLGHDALELALPFSADKESVVLGPGLSTELETRRFVHALVPRITSPLVIDADGLNLLAVEVSILAGRKPCSTILTPHPGEMARLSGLDTRGVQAQREAIAQEFAAAHQVVVVLKGHETVVASPDGAVAVNSTGNNGMATGGTGDVLAGLLGGLLAQGMPTWDAARLGVWLHGYAGDCAAQQFTARAMIARDVIACIPQAFAALVVSE
ncbi:MAG: NAD(P)H-hydrate dehydratase [Candidatus Hydrogenedentes bacterium]|nr:NAD(P)H-hydrate dehydratase [Candidatus Hydrogenedentota bacterium]